MSTALCCLEEGAIAKYGDFSADGSEFIIDRPDTPKNWENHILNKDYDISVSQTGSGSSYNRLTLSEKTSEEIGRSIFIRDNDTGEYWSIGHFPCEKQFDTFQAVHGLGYSQVASSTNKIDASVNFFVPKEDACEIWQVRINNTQKKKRRLSIFIYTELDNIRHSEARLKNNSLFINTRGAIDKDKLYFLGLDHTVDSYDTDKDIFIGPHRSIRNPRAIEDGKCSRSNSTKDPIAVVQRNITLGANTDSEFLVVAGRQPIDSEGSQSFPQARATAIKKAETLLGKYRRSHVAETALEEVKQYWAKLIKKMSVSSPDSALNHTQSLWAKYQMINTFNSKREVEVTSDLAEEISLVCSILPEEAEDRLRSLLSRQLKEGRTIESYNHTEGASYITDKVEGPAWLVIATTSLINEVGDLSLLKERAPYFDGGGGSVLEHLIRASKHCISQLNDRNTIEERYGLEVSYQTSLVYRALKEMLPLLENGKEHHLVRIYQSKLEQMKKSFNRRMWDGSWYLLSRNDQKVGSKKNPKHKIDLAAQVWPVSFGLADSKDKAEKAINNAWHHLNSPAGLANIAPPYPDYSRAHSESLDAPGEKTNGGINIKTASLALVSEALLGRGDLAYKIFQQHCPIYRAENQETYKIEPYYYADHLFGPASFKHGRGDGRMTSNASGWMWKSINEGIFGIQPVLGGLKIDPCIPRDWRQLEISRSFRGAHYSIRISNPTRQTRGVNRIIVDGIRQTGSVMKPFKTGVHQVEVFLG